MEVWVEVQSRAETLGKADGAWGWVFYAKAFRLYYEVAVDLFRYDSVNRGEEFFIGMDPVAHGNGKRDDKLPVRDKGQHVIYEMMRSFRHALSAA
jgi:hypothetical protein